MATTYVPHIACDCQPDSEARVSVANDSLVTPMLMKTLAVGMSGMTYGDLIKSVAKEWARHRLVEVVRYTVTFRPPKVCVWGVFGTRF